VYADKLMRTPENNPKGYMRSSAVLAAAQLKGRLLIVHGALDDNVHLQNAHQLIDALQTVNKDFELMIYPRDGHGFWSPHWHTLLLDFIEANL
jgi:dipeptidyl-peptidase-4